jgi:1-Cys peroxiredoxin 6
LLIEELPSKKEYLRHVKCPDMTDLKATTATVVGAPAISSEQTEQWRINLGAEMPDFPCNTTQQDFKFHDFLQSNAEAPWTLMVSHPKDFTPVCTTELGMCEQLVPEFLKRGVKMIAVSCDPVEDHNKWVEDILHREDKKDATGLRFPIIADEKREIVTLLGMLDPKEKDAAGLPLPARALILIDPEKKVRFSILYPATTGRNFSEVLRAVDSVMLTANHKLATPANWKQGDRCVVTPMVPSDEAKTLFKNFNIEQLPSNKEYLRLVDCPPIKGMEEETPPKVVIESKQQKETCC